MEKKDIFREHVVKTEVLIVDKNPSSRNRLLKIMFDLGCHRNKVYTCASLADAEQIIDSTNIGIVLSDYFIAGDSGFDLFKVVRAKRPTTKDLTLILVTANISQTAVAKAAEEDVDSFIIKPYTIQSIQENLISTIATKVKPSPYLVKTEEGKVLIGQQKYLEAIEVLKETVKLHNKPALALFYIGQAEYMQEMLEDAQGSYTTGLKFNNIHYKCLVGLYNMFVERQEWAQAYQVVKKIAKFFPANPDRLGEIIRLAIRTGNFEDMHMYYEIFTALEERDEMMVKYIGAGMYVSGKHFLMNAKSDEAVKFFDQVAVSCGEPKFLRAIINALIDFEQVAIAEKYLTRFPPGADDEADFKVSQFLIMSQKKISAGTLVKFGLDMYNSGVKDPRCMRIMIYAMEKCGYKKEMIAEFKKELDELEGGSHSSAA